MTDKSSLQLDEDIRLMIKARNGDRLAYDQLYSRYFHSVVSFLVRHNARRHACEDMAQEVFARVWYHRNRYQPLAPLKNYLLGVAANVLREDWAKSRGRVPLDSCDLETVMDTNRPSPPSQAQFAEQLQTVRTLMTSLTTRQRQAVELVYLAGLAPNEAAQRLGCSRQSLRSHLCSARRKLRELVRPSQPG
ncbi:MAG: sigma-70 family RNA polymerase sigma factor [Planctomycetes bacterium]|nr:sigma-70 family RNA polymerase sigma factor [Planctomycetota bacterium]